MKSIAFCLLLGIAFYGCSKSAGNTSSPGAAFSATVNGTSFIPSIAGGIDVTSGHFFYISGTKVVSGDTLILFIIVPDSLPLQTPIPFDGINTSMAYEDLETGVTYANNGIPAAPGSVTLTYQSAQSAQVAGNFSGTLYNSVNAKDSIPVTTGSFNVLYTTQ